MRYVFGDCVLDTARVELRRGGTVVPVEPLVYRLLALLIECRERVVSRDEVLARIWTGKVVSDATVANALKLARQAVGDNGTTQAVIRTVRGYGLRFVAAAEPQEYPAPRPARPEPAIALPELPDKPSLALLGFEHLGTHESGQLFAEGLAVDLNARLGRLSGLFVIARESARRFHNSRIAMPRIGRLLGVRYLVHGSSQREAKRVRITVNLLEAERQRVLWSEHFDRALDDVFAVQDEIVGAIVAALLPELERAEMERARLLPTDRLDAWECYYRAMWHNFRFTARDVERARRLLLEASALDPAFARAHAGLSFTHYLHAFLETDRQPLEHARLALEHAERSVGLDPRDAMGHWVLGRAQFLAREHEQALRSLERAMIANPSYAQGRYACGFVGVHAGQTARALEDLDSARRLSPFDPLLFAMKASRAIALAVEGDHPSAARWAVEATEEPNAHYHIHAISGACLQLAGRPEAARSALGRALQMHPGYTLESYQRSFPHRDPAQRELFAGALLAAGLPPR